MSDADDDTDNTENCSPTMVDPFAFLIELCHLAANPKAAEAVLKKLRRETVAAGAREQSCAIAAAKLEQQRAAIEADAAAIVAKAENDVKAIREDAQRRLDAAEAAEQDLAEREQKIARLEAAWRFIGEPADVMSGFRSPEYLPLQKARMAHGQPPGKDPDRLLFSEPDAAPAMRIDALSDTSDDPRADRQGTPFLGELTRDLAHKRGAV